MSNGQSAPPVPLNLAVEAQQGGIRISMVTPFLMTQVIIPEGHIAKLIAEIQAKEKEIPRVILPGVPK
jgi:hypothetical protein